MSPLVRKIVFIIVGLFVGSIVNMSLVRLGITIIAPPAGADMSTPEGIKAAMPLFSAQHFIFPFLAHALGTLVGAFVATRWSRSVSRTPALIVSSLFFLGGLTSMFVMPGAPMWFIAADLVLAYFPMGLMGNKLGKQDVEPTV